MFLLLPPLVYSGLVAKHGCPDRCGDLSIPYPFGVGSGCSLDPSFNISCDTSTSPPKAYITIIDKEVVEINDTYVRVKYPNYMASACYGLSDFKTYSMAVNLSGTPYTLISCDDMVVGTKQADGSVVMIRDRLPYRRAVNKSFTDDSNLRQSRACPVDHAK